MCGVPTEVVFGVCTISSRPGNGRRDTYGRVVRVHTVRDIDADDPANMNTLLAFETTQ